jgi:hypothetical protein
MRIDEEAHPHPRGLQPLDGVGEDLLRRTLRPSRLAGDFARLHRHQRALMRPHRQHQLDEIRAGIAFDVELDALAQRGEFVGNFQHVLPRDVPGVGPRMHGDAGRPGVDAHADRFDDRGQPATPRVTQRGDIVDVDRQLGGHE